jgi:hypothetical protein
VEIHSQLKTINMKKSRLIIGGLLLILAGVLHAQVGVNIVVGTPPAWGPAESSGVRFYYLPEIEAYYDVNTSNYIYMSGGRWIHATNLPPAYRNYDVYGGYKVMLNGYHGERPYDNFREHQRSYPRGYNKGHAQKTYGERPGNRGEHGKDEHGHEDKDHGDHR